VGAKKQVDLASATENLSDNLSQEGRTGGDQLKDVFQRELTARNHYQIPLRLVSNCRSLMTVAWPFAGKGVSAYPALIQTKNLYLIQDCDSFVNTKTLSPNYHQLLNVAQVPYEFITNTAAAASSTSRSSAKVR
jgi:hypothetical protein